MSKKFGPGLLIAAAFIGPGTVTTASLAGAQFGYALIWALLFSIIATFTLQEMASRLGLVRGQGLAETMRETLPSDTWRHISAVLILAAIGVGNAAYQGGNLTGASMALTSIAGGSAGNWALVLGVSASVILAVGRYQLLELVLKLLVALMSIVFVVTMLVAQPDWSAMFSALIRPQIPDHSGLLIIALIGTTVVPYNLFLHASLVNASSNTEDAPAATLSDKLRRNRIDAGTSIGLGGLVTLAILSCSAGAFFVTGQQMDAANIAQQLRPLLGDAAGYFFATGLFAAGLTSAITAPLAAAYAISGALGWQSDLTATRFKMIWLTIIVIGTLAASMAIKPLSAILFAQAANGLLLPIIAIYLLWLTNQRKVMAQHTNGLLANMIGFLVVALVVCLGLYKLWTSFN